MKRKNKKIGKKLSAVTADGEEKNGVVLNESATKNGDALSAGESEEGCEPEAKKQRKSNKRKSSEKEAEEEPQYEVEAILDVKNIRGVHNYLIRWKGYEPESDTWEPESTLNCAELISEFKAKQKKKKISPRKSSSTSRGRKISSTSVSSSTPSWSENDDFEVDRILEVHFKKNGNREFLVSWKGYPTSQNSWEPENNMDCKDLIEKFMLKVDKAREAEQRELRIKRSHTDRFTLSMGGNQGRRLSKRNQGKQRVQYHDDE